jgi:hypothetical protein
MPEESIIKLKRSDVSNRIPQLSSLEFGELALNTTDGKIFFKNSNNTLSIFLNSEECDDRNVNTFVQTTSSNILSSFEQITNQSSLITIFQANSAEWDIKGDRYFTTSVTTHSINKGVKVFIVDAGLSYTPTQDITIVHDHDIENHMHGTVLDYNSFTGSLTADITSRTGSGTYSNWRINIGGTPTFVDSLVSSNNLNDVSNPSVALSNLNGVSKTEIAGLSGNWQNTFSLLEASKSTWNSTSTLVQNNSAAWIGGSGDVVVNLDSASWRTDFVNNSNYIGKALPNTSENASSWHIKKITLNSIGQVLSTTVASNVSWNDRITVTYI